MTLKKYVFVVFSIILLCICKTAYPQTQPDSMVTQTQKEIVGRWSAIQGGESKWVFTKSGKTKTYIKKDSATNFSLFAKYTYNISRSGTHCGIDESDRLQRYPDESILTLKNTQTNSKKCFLIFGITRDYLTLSPFGSGHFLHFKKQK